MRKFAILGAGMAGFGAAHHLHSQGLPSDLYEMKPHYGGHAASYVFQNGFTIDEGPHVSFTKDERLRELFARSVSGQFRSFSTKVNNHWKGHWIKHPAQCNLYGLPVDLVTSVLCDMVNALNTDYGEINNYEDWLKAQFGKTFAETFPMEYGLKYHTTTADNMTTDWVGPRLYKPSLEEVLRGALAPNPADVHYIAEFRYPHSGGFVSFLKLFLDQTNLHLAHQVTQIDPRENVLRFSNGVVAPYDRLISSIPLPELIPLIKGTPPDILQAAAKLACSEVVIVTLGIERPDIIDAHWTYFYDRDYFLTRLSTPHLQSDGNVPPGCGSIQAECYYSKKYRPLDRRPEDCIEPVIADLRRCGLLRDDDNILFRHVMYLPYANVIFDLERAPALALVHGYLDDLGIAYCGRYGEWAYLWTDESFLSGERAAEKALGG